MSFFVDANVVLYSALDVAARDTCLRVLRAIAAGDAEGRTSPAVLEEIWYVASSRYRDELDGIADAAVKIFSPLLPVTEDALQHALSMPVSQLGTNDRLHVGTCVTHEIDIVLTGDRAFEGIDGIRRVDPFDSPAVDELLTAA